MSAAEKNGGGDQHVARSAVLGESIVGEVLVRGAVRVQARGSLLAYAALWSALFRDRPFLRSLKQRERMVSSSW